MGFQNEDGVIRWEMHFHSPPDKVYEALATAEGRAKYWAESAEEDNGVIEFNILGYPPFNGKVLETIPGKMYKIEYFGSEITFNLHSDQSSGTDMELNATNVNESMKYEMTAGWVSVLMAMKAAVDFGVDLRNHDEKRTWTQGFADN